LVSIEKSDGETISTQTYASPQGTAKPYTTRPAPQIGAKSAPQTFVSKDPTKPYYGKEVFVSQQGKILPTDEYKQLPSGAAFRVSETSPAVQSYFKAQPQARVMPTPFRTIKTTTTTPSGLYKVSTDSGQFIASEQFVSRLKTAQQPQTARADIGTGLPLWQQPSFRQEKISQLRAGTAPELTLFTIGDKKILKPEGYLLKYAGSPTRYYEKALVPQYKLERKAGELGIRASRQYQEFSATGTGYGKYLGTQASILGTGFKMGALEVTSAPITTTATVVAITATGGTAAAPTITRTLTGGLILSAISDTEQPARGIGRTAGIVAPIAAVSTAGALFKTGVTAAARKAAKPELTTSYLFVDEVSGRSGYVSQIARDTEYSFKYGKYTETYQLTSRGFQQDIKGIKASEEFSKIGITQKLYKEQPILTRLKTSIVGKLEPPELISQTQVKGTQDIRLVQTGKTEFEGLFTFTSKDIGKTTIGVTTGSKVEIAPKTYQFISESAELSTIKSTKQLIPKFGYDVKGMTGVFTRELGISKSTQVFKGSISTGTIMETDYVSIARQPPAKSDIITYSRYFGTQETLPSTLDISGFDIVPEPSKPSIKGIGRYPREVWKITPTEATKSILSPRKGQVLTTKTIQRQPSTIITPSTDLSIISQVKSVSPAPKVETPSIITIPTTTKTTTIKEIGQIKKPTPITTTRLEPISKTRFRIESDITQARQPMLKQISKPDIRTRQVFTPISETAFEPIQRTKQAQVVITSIDTKQKTKFQTQTIFTPSVTYKPDIKITFRPEPTTFGGVKLLSFGSQGFSLIEPSQKPIKFRSKYSPSVEAALFDVKGVMPSMGEISTGLNIRPLLR